MDDSWLQLLVKLFPSLEQCPLWDKFILVILIIIINMNNT